MERLVTKLCIPQPLPILWSHDPLPEPIKSCLSMDQSKPIEIQNPEDPHLIILIALLESAFLMWWCGCCAMGFMLSSIMLLYESFAGKVSLFGVHMNTVFGEQLTNQWRFGPVHWELSKQQPIVVLCPWTLHACISSMTLQDRQIPGIFRKQNRSYILISLWVGGVPRIELAPHFQVLFRQ